MVIIDSTRCTGCGQCAKNCAVHAIIREEDGTYRCNSGWCFACGQCVALCPVGAASMPELEEPLPYTQRENGALTGSYAVSEIVSACKIDL